MAIVILDKQGNISSLYTSWLHELKLELDVEVITDFDLNFSFPFNTSLVVSAQHYKLPEYSLLNNAMILGIPVLILVDGILEFRNTWLRDDIIPEVLFRPVIGSKIACMGPSQVRIIEQWGNVDKCVNIGFPAITNFSRPQNEMFETISPNTIRIGICSAKKPYFSDKEKRLFEFKMERLCNKLMAFCSSKNVHFIVSWRIPEDAYKQIFISGGNFSDISTESFKEFISSQDILITQPSTVQIEGMYHKKRVVVFNLYDMPLYVNSAWIIEANVSNLKEVLESAIEGRNEWFFYQEQCLLDALRLDGDARERLISLIKLMSREKEEGVLIEDEVRKLSISNNNNWHALFQKYCGGKYQYDSRVLLVENMLLKQSIKYLLTSIKLFRFVFHKLTGCKEKC